MPVLVLAALTSLAGLPPDTVFISEVVYNPVGTEPDTEWVEIVNVGTAPALLDEIRLSDAESTPDNEGALQFPAGTTLAPGQIIVVANKASAYRAATGRTCDFEVKPSDGTVPDLSADTHLGTSQLNLANTSDEIFLLDPAGFILDGVTWGHTSPIQGVVDIVADEGDSIARTFSNGVPAPWFTGTPTPGTAELGVLVEQGGDDDATGEGEGEGEGEGDVGGEGEGDVGGEGEGDVGGEGEGDVGGGGDVGGEGEGDVGGEGEGEGDDSDPSAPSLPVIDDGEGNATPLPRLTQGNEATVSSGCAQLPSSSSSSTSTLAALLALSGLLRRRR